MVCISTLMGKESKLTGSERPGSFGCLLLICLLVLCKHEPRGGKKRTVNYQCGEVLSVSLLA